MPQPIRGRGITSCAEGRYNMSRPCQLTFNLSTLKVLESRVTWATSANFGLPRPLCLCSRLRPDVRDRQTDVRRALSLNAPYLGAGHNKSSLCRMFAHLTLNSRG